MNNLFTYVRAIASEPQDSLITSSTNTDLSYQDDGIKVECTERCFNFANGAVIKQTVELEVIAAPSDAVCPECWINYEVVSEPQGFTISPQRKVFINKCQESFWLKMNASDPSI